MTSKRSCGELRASDDGSTVELNGWVHRRRDHGGLIFIDLRDREGITQIVFDPREEAFKEAEHLRHEDVIKAAGSVRKRPAGTQNEKLDTGEIEVGVKQLEILNRSLVPPFPVNLEEDVDENLRLEYRYLELRKQRLQNNLALRHRIVKAMRDFFDERGFLEIETPMLIKSTPEGARDYLVPSRTQPGSFYALPQSPQLLKQTLMIAGFGKYMQIARCMRDEDPRSDRQFEFTQLDVEMSFCTQEEVMEIMESCMRTVWKRVLDFDLPPFPRLSHADALARYGIDKPDLRFDLELRRADDIFAQTEFGVFRNVLQNGGAIVALRYPGGGSLSRREFDALIEVAKGHGSKGMVWIALTEGGVKSSAAKFLDEDSIRAVQDCVAAQTGDAILLFADTVDQALAIGGKMRNEIGSRAGLRDPQAFAFAWVTDFPLFEADAETGKPSPAHHPFTAPGEGEWDLLETEPFRMKAQHYDMVLNGVELGSGSIRIHQSEPQRKIFSMLGLSQQEIDDRFGFFLRALDYGAPPHGGMAIGIDRILMIATGEDNIRDVVAFPKNQLARDVMMDAPSPVPERLLRDLWIRSIPPPASS